MRAHAFSARTRLQCPDTTLVTQRPVLALNEQDGEEEVFRNVRARQRHQCPPRVQSGYRFGPDERNRARDGGEGNRKDER